MLARRTPASSDVTHARQFGVADAEPGARLAVAGMAVALVALLGRAATAAAGPRPAWAIAVAGLGAAAAAEATYAWSRRRLAGRLADELAGVPQPDQPRGASAAAPGALSPAGANDTARRWAVGVSVTTGAGLGLLLLALLAPEPAGALLSALGVAGVLGARQLTMLAAPPPPRPAPHPAARDRAGVPAAPGAVWRRLAARRRRSSTHA